MKRTMGILVLLILVALLSMLWFVFGTLGMRPWNKKCYTRQELVQIARDQNLLTAISAYCPDRTHLTLDYDDNDSSAPYFPIYRVFDKRGMLLSQHCCFESVPGFIDSTRCNRQWSTIRQDRTLTQYVHGLREMHSNDTLSLNDSTSADFTILYYWDTILGYNLDKARSVVSRCQHDSSLRLVLVNINDYCGDSAEQRTNLLSK